MFNYWEKLAFSFLFLQQFCIYNCVTSSDRTMKNYELFDSEYSFSGADIKAEIVALLVEDNPRNFKSVLGFFESISSGYRYKNTDFWLLTFNSSGVSTVWEKKQDNINQFHDKLKSLASQNNYENPKSSNQSLPIFALLNAAQILPENTAIVIFMDSMSLLDAHLEKVALNQILSKNITVYAAYNKEPKVIDLLKNIIEFSGGDTIQITGEPKFELYSQGLESTPGENVSVLLARKKLKNTYNLSFPIDHDVTGFHIIISPSKTTMGMVISPIGYKLSFVKNAKTNFIRYSRGSVFENQNDSFEVHLNLTTSRRNNVGNWNLILENSEDFYNVSIFAFTSISAEARIHSTDEGKNNEITKDVLKLGVTGKVSHITDISVLDINGEAVLSNVSYKFNSNRLKYVTENRDNGPDITNKEINVEINRLQNTQPVYALIKGKDIKGNQFQRLSYIFNKVHSDIYPQQFLTVEVGLGSEVIAAPLKQAEIYFEVTNNANSAQLVTFTCSDQKYILQSLSIFRKYLEPQESSLVTLYFKTNPGTYQDQITFSASSGSLVVQKKVLVDVGSQITDQNKPELSHTFTSDCTGVILTSCEKGSWTIEITARDTESGLLQLNTVPKGLYFPHGYISGTKDAVTGHYSESCCNPKLQISAVDRMNNVNTYEVNAYNAIWSPGAIAALVLGVLFLLILVAVAIYFVVRYCRTKETYDLPTYRGGGGGI